MAVTTAICHRVRGSDHRPARPTKTAILNAAESVMGVAQRTGERDDARYSVLTTSGPRTAVTIAKVSLWLVVIRVSLPVVTNRLAERVRLFHSLQMNLTKSQLCALPGSSHRRRPTSDVRPNYCCSDPAYQSQKVPSCAEPPYPCDGAQRQHHAN